MLETFRALADPNRLQILDLLAGEPLPVGVVAERLRIRQPQASKHLRALSDAGLVEFRAEAQRRIYGLRPQPFHDLAGWLDRFRGALEPQFERLDEVLAEMQRRKKRKKEKRKHKRDKRSS